MSGAPPGLARAAILVLEDDYYLAEDLLRTLEEAGATVLGPCPGPAEAERLIEGRRPDCAFLDLNLGGGPSFDFPRALTRAGIPFAFVTGYDRQAIPDEFAAVERLEKPVEPRNVVAVAARLLGES